MAAYNIGTVTLNSAGSLTVKCKRGERAGSIFEYHCPGDYDTIMYVHESAGWSVSGSLTLYKAGSLNDSLASVGVGWDGEQVINASEPDPLPNCGTVDGSSPDVANQFKLYKTQTSACYGQAAVSDSDLLAGTYNYGKYYGLYFGEEADGHMTVAVSFAQEATITLSVSGSFDVYAELEDMTLSELENYRRRVQDHDLYGLISKKLNIYYVPNGAVTVSVTGPCGNHSWELTAADFADEATFLDFFRYGLGAVQIATTATGGFWSRAGWDSIETGASGSITGTGMSGGATADTEAYAPTGYESYPVSYNPGTGAWSMLYDGAELTSYTPGVTVMKGAFTVPYTGAGGDFDGTTRSGNIMTCDWNEGEQDDPLLCPVVGSATFSSRGSWDLLWGTSGIVHHLVATDFPNAGSDYAGDYPPYSTHGSANDTSAQDTHYGGLQDLDTLGEPNFPAPEETPNAWFDDSRVECEPNITALQWDDAIEFTIADSIVAADLSDDASWSVTAGAATLTEVNLGSVEAPDYRLKVEVTAVPCTIEKTFASGKMIGARIGRLSFSADDTGDITIEVGGKTWTVSTGSPTFDLLAPSGSALTDQDQSAPGSSPNASWGVWDVGTVKLSGLRDGKTYWLKELIGERVSAANGAFAEVQVFNEAFVGKEQGGLASDAFTHPNGLALYIDGVCAGTWAGGLLSELDSELAPGAGGLVSVAVNDDTGWKQAANVDSYYLVPGIYSIVDGVITVPARMRASQVLVPLCWGNSYAMRFAKLLRGVTNITLADTGNRMRHRNVLMEQRYTSAGTVVGTASFTTNKCGWLRTTPLQQPIFAHDNFYKFKTQLEGTAWAEVDVDIRNRYGSRAVFVDSFLTSAAASADCDVLRDPVTGIAFRAFVENSQLLVQRSLDDGKTFENPMLLSAAGTPSRPSLYIDHDDQRRYFGLDWQEGTTTKSAKTALTFTGAAGETLWTDMSNLRTEVDSSMGVTVKAGWRSSDGYIVACVSIDGGTTFGSWVQVVEVPEQVFGLSGDAEKWVIACVNSSAEQVVYWSLDNGLTWQLAN